VKETLGEKRRWTGKWGRRKWVDDIAEIINAEREAFKKYISTG
jgi:hypothetical protein